MGKVPNFLFPGRPGLECSLFMIMASCFSFLSLNVLICEMGVISFISRLWGFEKI